jgi:cytochrome P450
MTTILTAAADTSGHAMALITYHVVSNPDLYAALTTELKFAFPDHTDDLDYLTLEKLPYLTTVGKEWLGFS